MIKSRAKALLAPMAHQKESLAHDKRNPVLFDMSDPGTGKTAVRVWSFATRRRARGACLLVLAPRSLLRTAWGNDFARFAPDMKVVVATAANRKQALAETADVYVVNHDAVKELVKQPKAWFDKFDEFVVDECTAYKHHTSQRSKAIAKISKMSMFKFRRLLSATPTSNGICDMWHQIYLLDGGKRLGPSFYAFRETVCTPRQVGASKHAIQWTDKPGAEEAVFNELSDIVIRHKFEDCVDIPPTHFYSVDYTLEPKQRKTYDELERAQLLFLAGTKVTAINAAAVATKLLQVASGAVYDGTGKYVVVDRGRYEALIDMAKVRKHPLLLFFWQHQRDMLVEEAEKANLKFCVFDGELNDNERATMIYDYQSSKYDLMLGHPKTVAHGLTLTAGTSVIWPGPTYNLEWWKQANKRQARIGQKAKTEVVTMIAPNTIEQKVYDMCMGKEGRMSNLLDLFESWTATPVPTKVARKLAAA
jgi:SNF2 family DNA or RNA helicase